MNLLGLLARVSASGAFSTGTGMGGSSRRARKRRPMSHTVTWRAQRRGWVLGNALLVSHSRVGVARWPV
ncbi:hypothetical protein [Nonomuraea africana]|uniref:Secreted protein n=1 Tax=Nonomuraea africana TaxID=46171 RepID=A0ABR9KDG8_9ACTN|nr:hypothetical protein [Nonomuraea africana]MBE1560063.1 hypothetical protein [Nonomuraea africana]